MTGQYAVEERTRRSRSEDLRERLLAGLAVTERRLKLAGVSTAVLEGGEGVPVVLLHGPGEFAGKWMRVLPDLVMTNRVIAPTCRGTVPRTSPTVDSTSTACSRGSVS